jgi:hypothetical protein
LHRIGEQKDDKSNGESGTPAVQAGKAQQPGHLEAAQRLKGR